MVDFSPSTFLAKKVDGEKSTKPSSLDSFTSNLCEKARLGEIDPLLGREEEVLRTVQVLSRRRKNNPLFVGQAGVGKTAIAQGLAKKIVDGQVPDVLKKAFFNTSGTWPSTIFFASP